MKKPKDKSEKRNGKMERKAYEKALRKLQVGLCYVQEWVKTKGLRVIIVFEGRDAAGKGGTIKAITERVSPRVFRVVALPAPSDREKIADVHAALHASTSLRPAKSSSSIAAGTTAPASNASWALSTSRQYERFLNCAPSSRSTWSKPASS